MDKMIGKVWVLGDDIDTDIIIPTEYLALKTIDDMKGNGIRVFCNTKVDRPVAFGMNKSIFHQIH